MTLVAIVEISESCAPPITETRCPACRKVLFHGTLHGAIKCPRCHALVKFGGRVQ